jgi:hypothetical protein
MCVAGIDEYARVRERALNKLLACRPRGKWTRDRTSPVPTSCSITFPSTSMDPHCGARTDVGLTRPASKRGNCERRGRYNPHFGDLADRLEPTAFALHRRARERPGAQRNRLIPGLNGAEHRVRTGDLRLGKATLYQLS